VALPAETLAALDHLARFGIRLGLDRVRALLEALGHPETRFPSVLVAGTNGKGTVSALLSSFATAGRYRVGLYTSPHLEEVEERIRLDGVAIDGERLGTLVERVLAAAAEALDEPLTYFEALTACALLYFAEEEVDLAVLEVGLGGRFDATNAVDPLLSVVTPIDLDHREHLGATLEEVAREKAGVLRPEVPAVVAAMADGPETVLAAEAERLGARLVRVRDRLGVDAIQRFRPFLDPPERRQRVWLRPPAAVDVPGVETESEVYELALSGRHQAENLATAVAVAGELRELGWERLTVRALKKGAAACRWPGRLEEVVLPDGPEAGRVLFDVAHNPGAATALAEFLGTLKNAKGRVDMVFGALSDKEPAPMLERLLPRVGTLYLTRPSGERGMGVDVLRAAVPVVGTDRRARAQVVEEPVPARALRRALEGAEGRVVVVCGSLVLVGELREALRRRYGVPEPAAAIPTGA